MYVSIARKYSGGPLRAIFNVAEMGRFNVGEIGTGRNIHPKANMGHAIDRMVVWCAWMTKCVSKMGWWQTIRAKEL